MFTCTCADVEELGGDAVHDDVSVWVQRAQQAEENLSRAMEDLHKLKSDIYTIPFHAKKMKTCTISNSKLYIKYTTYITVCPGFMYFT